jgi:hypothetical protein
VNGIRSNGLVMLAVAGLCSLTTPVAADQPKVEVAGAKSAEKPKAAGSEKTKEPGTAVTPPPPSSDTAPPTGDDHEQVTGHFGLGFFGVETIPSGSGDITAPTLGFRYWSPRMPSLFRKLGVKTMGVEFAVGLGIGTASSSLKAQSLSNTKTVALGLHAALPLALAHASHFTFIVVPEVDFAFSAGSSGDQTVNGALFHLGVRGGGEIQFGFMGLPQVALQATVGLGARYQGRTQGDVSSTSFNFATSVQGSPWEIFAGNVAAIYYF